jgi:hypothetical protein
MQRQAIAKGKPMTILDDIAAQKAAITSTADGYISAAKQTDAAHLTEMQALDAALADLETAGAAKQTDAAHLTEMQALDAALADLETAGAAERAKLALAIAALGGLNLGPTPAAPAA